MAKVQLTIGGRRYDVSCRDGEENHLIRLSEMIDTRMATACRASPGLTEVRQLLFAAVLLADEVHDLKAEQNKKDAGQSAFDLPHPDDSAAEIALARQIDTLSARIEAFTDRLAGKRDAP